MEKLSKAEALAQWARIPKKVQRAVRAGAELLDRKRRDRWQRKVKVPKLAMEQGWKDADGCGCVIAQLYPGYTSGLRQLDIDARGEDFGFSTFSERQYRKLDKAWQALLSMEQ